MEESEKDTITAFVRAEKTALRLIARAEQCTKGLTRKLTKRGFDANSINEVISNLTEKNLLNDSRYARYWIQSRLRFARTPKRLLSSLCARGLDHSDAESALNEVLTNETEAALLTRFLKKYARKILKCEDGAQRLKFLLKSEGFSAEVIEQYKESCKNGNNALPY